MASCKKETPELSNQTNSNCVYDISSNTKDSFGKSFIVNMQNYMSIYEFSNTGRDQYIYDYQTAAATFSSSNPWDTTTSVQTVEISLLKDLKDIYSSSESESDLFSDFVTWETSVANSNLSEARKTRILKIGSFFKHYTKYMLEVVSYQKSLYLTSDEIQNLSPNGGGFAQ